MNVSLENLLDVNGEVFKLLEDIQRAAKKVEYYKAEVALSEKHLKRWESTLNDLLAKVKELK